MFTTLEITLTMKNLNIKSSWMLPEEAELVSEWTGLSGKTKSVKRFERAKGLDTALYKTTFTFFMDMRIWVLRNDEKSDVFFAYSPLRSENKNKGTH